MSYDHFILQVKAYSSCDQICTCWLRLLKRYDHLITLSLFNMSYLQTKEAFHPAAALLILVVDFDNSKATMK